MISSRGLRFAGVFYWGEGIHGAVMVFGGCGWRRGVAGGSRGWSRGVAGGRRGWREPSQGSGRGGDGFRAHLSRVLDYVFITIAKILMEILKVVVQYEK